MKVRPKVQ